MTPLISSIYIYITFILTTELRGGWWWAAPNTQITALVLYMVYFLLNITALRHLILLFRGKTHTHQSLSHRGGARNFWRQSAEAVKATRWKYKYFNSKLSLKAKLIHNKELWPSMNHTFLKSHKSVKYQMFKVLSHHYIYNVFLGLKIVAEHTNDRLSKK